MCTPISETRLRAYGQYYCNMYLFIYVFKVRTPNTTRRYTNCIFAHPTCYRPSSYTIYILLCCKYTAHEIRSPRDNNIQSILLLSYHIMTLECFFRGRSIITIYYYSSRKSTRCLQRIGKSVTGRIRTRVHQRSVFLQRGHRKFTYMVLYLRVPTRI